MIGFRFFLYIGEVPLSQTFSFVGEYMGGNELVAGSLTFLFLHEHIVVLSVVSIGGGILNIRYNIFGGNFFKTQKSFAMQMHTSVLIFHFGRKHSSTVTDSVTLYYLQFVV